MYSIIQEKAVHYTFIGYMFDKLKRILDANDSLSMDRARIVATFCDSCALTYHVLIFFVFIFLKVYPMVIYNVFSIAFFTFTLFRIQKADSFVRIYSWCSAEVIPHQILSDYFLGTNANFHFFILLMGLIPFLIFKNKSKFLVPFAAFTSLLFIIIENCRNQPEYEIALFTQSVLRLANVSLSVGIIFFMILIFTYIVDNYETKLHKINLTLESEIALASVIQQNFFRQDLAEVKNVEISFYNKPMVGVSGDVYDFYKSGSKLDGFGLFDISGHGISSGLVTMLVKNIIIKEFYDHSSLELWEIMDHINERVILEKGGIQNYLTGVLVRFSENGKIELVSAGHPMPVIYHKDTGRCELLKQDSSSVGAIGIAGFPHFYNSIFVDFKKGDEIILYSDGVSDVSNENGEEFGVSRFMHAIEANASKKISVNEQAAALVREIELFRGKKAQTDDLTFIILKNTLES